jgi:outer membrane lipoprotein-sorting protein
MRIAVAVVSILLLLPNVFAQTYTSDQVLAKMDEKAKSFKSLEASVEVKSKQELTGSEDTDSGKVFLQATGKSARVKMELTEPKARRRFALVDKGLAQMYVPSQKNLQEGKVKDDNQSLLLLLGFGVTSDRIKAAYNVGAAKQESFNKAPVTMLELTPKQLKGATYKSIVLWISHTDWTPVKIQLYDGTLTTSFTYKEKKLNKSLSDSIFKLDIPKDVKRS